MFALGPARIPQGTPFPQGTRLNSSHPLAQGLGFFAVAQGQLAYDLVAGTSPTLTGALVQKTLRNGQALTFTGAVGNRLTWPTTTAAQWVNANSFTVSALGLLKGTDFAAGSNSYPVLLKFASSSSHILCSIENNGGTINFSATADNLTPVIGAVTIGNFASTNALGFSADNIVALYTWRINGTTCDCFINGVLVDTLTLVGHGAAVTAAIATANSGAGWSAAGAIQAWYVHNRALSQSEIAQLATSPWCMLANVAAPDPYLFDNGATSGASGTSATTNANDTSAASGTTTVVGTSTAANANDTSSAAGTTKILGTSATTNANDTSSASGTPKVVGSSATTNANDTSSAAGTPKVVGTSASTNAADTSTASGSVGSSVSGAVAYTNANDTGSASGTTKILGTSGTTNANDTAAASGTTTVKGSSAITNANDTATASGVAGSVTGTAADTNGNDVCAASGTVGDATPISYDGLPRPVTQPRRRPQRQEIEEDVQAAIAQLTHVTAKAQAVVAAPAPSQPFVLETQINDAMQQALRVIDDSLSAIQRTQVQMAMTAAREAQRRLEAQREESARVEAEQLIRRARRRKAALAAAAYFFGDD
jgi:hypothetical protein